jgi:hypothetical protein
MVAGVCMHEARGGASRGGQAGEQAGGQAGKGEVARVGGAQARRVGVLHPQLCARATCDQIEACCCR